MDLSRTTALGLSLLMLTSCAENPATGGQMFTLVGADQERAIGQASANQELEHYGMYRAGSATTQYVTKLCEKMYGVTEVAGQPVSCIVVDSDTYNAWATPGYINVYRGFLPYVESEAELAAVLGHESGHIAARHIAQGQTMQTLAGLAMAAAGIYVASQSDNGKVTKTALQLGSVAAGLALAKYSRSHESEADGLAQRYLARAGYDPRESVNMVRSMANYENYMGQYVSALTGNGGGRDMLAQLTSSHPATGDRIAAAVRGAGEPDGTVRLPDGVAPATPRTDPQGRNRFLNAIDGLTYGPQRSWGIAGRDYIALPAARTVVKLADGFILHYEEGAEKPENGLWVGRHPQTDVRLKVLATRYKAGMNVGVALQQGFPGMDDLQKLALADGREAYTGLWKPSGMTGETVRVVGIPVPEEDKMVVVGFNFPDDATRRAEEATLMKVAAQSRVVGDAAASRWQPLKLVTRTVGAGDTVASLAARMPQGTLREEWFRALNNLPAGDVRVGQRVKLVVDSNGV